MNESTLSNQNVITYVTGTVCVSAIICVVTYCILSFYGVEVSQGFSLLTGGLVGSLTSMLIKTSPTVATPSLPLTPNGDAPTQVQVVNQPDAPVPTEEQPKVNLASEPKVP